MNDRYDEAVSYIDRIPTFAKKNTPEVNRRFYEYLGCPCEGAAAGSEEKRSCAPEGMTESRKMPWIIHVAGTNGKGSVCSYINNVLTHAGYKTAMFTSPHLVDIRERFRANCVQTDGGMIPKEDFSRLFCHCLEKIESFRMESEIKEYHPAYFEILFFIGMLWFRELHLDVILLETGMGGRADVTNVIKTPAVTVITKIGLDHTEFLGNTKERIAAEKAGIIKENVPVIFWDDNAEVSRVIVEKARTLKAEVVSVSENQVASYIFKNKTVDFSLRSEYYDYVKVFLHTTAVYQRENAALAVRALEVLKRYLEISREQIENGLSAAKWDGRMDEVLPNVFIDGAHNEDGINAFLECVRQDGCLGKRMLLFSVVADKRADEMTEKIIGSGLFSEIAVAQIDSYRSLKEEQLLTLWRGEAELFSSPEEAFKALIGKKNADDKVYAAGSLYLAGQLLAWIRKSE